MTDINETDTGYRIETDSIGSKKVPKDAYYGVQTQRAYENFKISGLRCPRAMIISMAQIKKACAMTNFEVGCLDQQVTEAIIQACDMIIAGKYHDQFIVDAIQGGAGTSVNMNANEVIANIANELLGGQLGVYDKVHPNDHVNFGQSTNDVFPSCGQVTALKLLHRTQAELERLYDALMRKSIEFDGVIKMGRTQLQDAVPIRLGQEFHAYATAISRDIKRFEDAKDEMRTINLGGTAIGTGLNANSQYQRKVVDNISHVTGLRFNQALDLIDSTQNLDGYVAVSGVTKSCAVNLSKMANDLRLMSCGPRCGIAEINLPPKQNGSSIMPGKVNPVIPEVVSQIAYNIMGNDVTITMAAEAGQLELNAFEPVIFFNLFHSIEQLGNVVSTFIDNCIVDITANEEHCRQMVDNSVGIVTALCPYIGYTRAAELAKEAIKTGASVRDLVLREELMSKHELDLVLDAYALTEPGIPGEKYMRSDSYHGARK